MALFIGCYDVWLASQGEPQIWWPLALLLLMVGFFAPVAFLRRFTVR
jgi:hypothetical protein